MGEPYDVIVIGCGLSAGSFIHRLALRDDLRVLVIDRGAFTDPAGLTSVADYAGLPRKHDTILFATGGSTPRPVKKWWARDVAGGGSLTWYGQLSRFEDADFHMERRARSLARHDLATLYFDWPIGGDVLKPWYDEVEAFLEPTRASLDPRGLPIGRRRTRLSSLELSLLTYLEGAGLKGESGLTCLGGRAWERNPVDPISLRPLTGPGLLQRKSWLSSTWALASSGGAIEVRQLHDVRRVLFEKCRVAGVEIVPVDEPDGRAEFVAARHVVMAASPIETVVTLLRSNFPDEAKHLGTRFTYTNEATAYVATDIPRSQDPDDEAIGSFSSIVVKDFYNGGGQACIKGGKVAIYDALACEAPDKRLRSTSMSDRIRSRALSDAKRSYVLKLSFKGESTPWDGKFVTAEAYQGDMVPCVHYELHPQDHLVHQLARLAFKQIAAAVPGGEIISTSEPSGAELISGHQHGGAWFGNDPAASVINKNCESWAVRGLHIVDASFMPTSGATNSSLTVSANAFRVADHLARII